MAALKPKKASNFLHFEKRIPQKQGCTNYAIFDLVKTSKIECNVVCNIFCIEVWVILHDYWDKKISLNNKGSKIIFTHALNANVIDGSMDPSTSNFIVIPFIHWIIWQSLEYITRNSTERISKITRVSHYPFHPFWNIPNGINQGFWNPVWFFVYCSLWYVIIAFITSLVLQNDIFQTDRNSNTCPIFIFWKIRLEEDWKLIQTMTFEMSINHFTMFCKLRKNKIEGTYPDPKLADFK